MGLSKAQADRLRRGGVRRFTVTENHVKLLRRLVIRDYPDFEWGGPAVDFKRPFGNGDRDRDMRRILGWPEAPEYAARDAELDRLYGDLGTVLEIFLRTGSMEPGTYVTPRYHDQWEKEA